MTNKPPILTFPHRGRKCAFTLAEVLITLGIIGVVAAITLSSLITNIQNKGYVEGMKKAYTILQAATNEINQEEPLNFIADSSEIRANNYRIIDKYEAKLKTVKKCLNNFWGPTACNVGSGNYYFLNGDKRENIADSYYSPYHISHSLVLADGITISFQFKNNPAGGYLWGAPDLAYIVDVNGKKGPNKNGRDIFYFYYKNGKIVPFGDKNGTSFNGNSDFIDDCNKDGKGFSCAYRIITEGKMNY